MHKLINIKTLTLAVAAVLWSGCHSITEIGEVNGRKVTKIVTRSLIEPCTTTLVSHDPHVPGEIDPLNEASGPGFVPALATGGGIAAGGALRRPDRASSSVRARNESSSSFVPPGQQK